MRGLSDKDVCNENIGETMGQYWKRHELEEIRSWIERGTCIVIAIVMIVLVSTAF